MRPNQQNKNRSRGRNNNGGRKHGNPLSRNYESNGPDVKVRGNAAHIAEKYVQLARDAQASGDSVMAENYLQHAEHYFRILVAAQQQVSGVRDQFAPQDEDDFDDEPINDRFSLPERPQFGQPNAPQPQQQPQAQGGESGESAEAPVVEAAEAGDVQTQGEDGPRHRRDRRPRRRRPGGGEGDPANAPQPDVGELPAFLTAGTPAAE